MLETSDKLPTSGPSLLDVLLADQQKLRTPVARFSEAHDRGASPALEPVYRDLIPLTAPGPGEQYAFEVDLDSCTGCKACVAACHALNGLDETEAWRDVGLLLGGDAAQPFQQTITTACHHCADPGCLTGCPVLAYEKDPRTGIVRHLDDQCIGCQYCVLTCPYDVPKYNERLGIVRKCDMCHQRLGAGEAPACVQACPTHAIQIVTVYSSNRQADTSHFLPTAPDPALTQPTTRYLSAKPLPADLHAADAGSPRVQPAHQPLAVMLVLTQLALGLQLAAVFAYYAKTGSTAPSLTWAAWGAVSAGIVVSIAHLGQPLRAWRIFLNLRESWLSREAVLFSAWFASLGSALAVEHGWLEFSRHVPTPPFAAVALVLGTLGVACSAMIYAVTGRAAWRAAIVFPKFFGTVLVVTATVLSPPVGAAAVTLKLFAEELALHLGPAASRQLAWGALRPVFLVRRGLGGLGAGLLLLSLLAPNAWLLGAALVLGGEYIERRLFFRAVDASRMPGQPSA